MPKGIQAKHSASVDRKPDDIWWWICNGETVKTCQNKKSFDMWVRLHLKKCADCRQRETDSSPDILWTKEVGRVNQSGHLMVTKEMSLR
jgi:hypothetical protein